MSLASQFNPSIHLHNFCNVIKKTQKKKKKNSEKKKKKKKKILYICKQPLMMNYEGSESARENLGKFLNQLQPKTKTLIRKLERILIRLNVFSLFNQTCLKISEQTLS